MASETSVLNRLIKNAKKKNDPLTPLIDHYFLERDHSSNRYHAVPADITPRVRPPGRMSPSSICGCQRQAVLKFTGMKGKRKVDPETEAILDDGTWRHLRLGWQLKDMEAVLGRDIFQVISVEENVSFPPLYIAGNLDIVVRIHGLLYVIDFKGINSYGFEYVFRNDQPKAEHVLQVICYCKMRKIRRGMLYYEDKNTNRTKIFPVAWDSESWGQIDRWCSEVLDHLNNQRLPPAHPECRDGRFLFNRCPFSRHCFGSQTAAQIERQTYQGYPGTDALWELGQRLADQT